MSIAFVLFGLAFLVVCAAVFAICLMSFSVFLRTAEIESLMTSAALLTLSLFSAGLAIVFFSLAKGA
jgi:hypothetical protein